MDWMQELSVHYQHMRRQYPKDKLLLLFDIDGTILDMRYMIRDLLQAWDRTHRTTYFSALTIGQITVSERDIAPLVDDFCPPDIREVLLEWYRQHRWDFIVMQDSHRSYGGVLELIRWFQMQDNTEVGLNTARPEALRLDTLHSLNNLGREYRVRFDPRLLCMSTNPDEISIEAQKLAGIEQFRQQGYRVICVIDNQLENIHAMAGSRELRDLLLLHSCKLFERRRHKSSHQPAAIPHYEPEKLICRTQMPGHVQMVWSHLDDEKNLNQFLNSTVHWAAINICDDGLLNRQSEKLAQNYNDLEHLLDRFRLSGRGVRLGIDGDETLVTDVLGVLVGKGYVDTDLWFEGRMDVMGEKGFRAIAREYPGALLQCPIDFLAPLIIASPTKAEHVLDMMSAWGVNRWSISWQTAGKREVLDQLDAWGFDANIEDVPDMSSFLHAVLLLPRSITTDFCFPASQPGSHWREVQNFLSNTRITSPMVN